ncbi:E3 ubiquitin-protein ligase APD2-like [Corylus avellana]|uniref:E3 ubiquitin-protein ligase APD2-like n=1 Tax=Corylus avellana TaxID=13451 RepID=UPI00286B7475|nr:E3 ubiquitin-protein ligase APD2-like [Corylus avellana]
MVTKWEKEVQEEEEVEENERQENGDNHHPHHHHHHHHILLNRLQQHHRPSIVSYRMNISMPDAASTEMRDDMWSCLVVLVTFWFFAASMTLIFGFYGSVNTHLGPNCSRLIQTNPFFVQSIQAEEMVEPKRGPILYGFYEPPPLDVEITWTETLNAIVPAIFRKAHSHYLYFLFLNPFFALFY